MCRAQDGDRGGPAAGGGMPQETWARGPPEARDRDRDGGGFRGGAGGGGGFRPPPGRWAERRAAAEERGGGGKDYGGGVGERGDGGGKGFARGDRGDREKDLEKWGKVRGVCLCVCMHVVLLFCCFGGGVGTCEHDAAVFLARPLSLF